MDQIKTTTETIIAYGNDTWENLGEITLYHPSYNKATGTLLFKMVPGLGKRFKVVFENKTYTIEKFTPTTDRFKTCNAQIGSLNRFLSVDGYE